MEMALLAGGPRVSSREELVAKKAKQGMVSL
jgi:hypothetical protein